MQLLETSLDTNLLNNAVKVKFPHSAVLPGGVSVQETLNNVVVLICTSQSVHRLVLPHPTRMYRSVSTWLGGSALKVLPLNPSAQRPTPVISGSLLYLNYHHSFILDGQ